MEGFGVQLAVCVLYQLQRKLQQFCRMSGYIKFTESLPDWMQE